MEKVTAVVVTYNRFELVKNTINALRCQTRKLDNIIVIDNNCTDGTSEWLDNQSDLYVIHQENVGGSGGFWRGIKEAYERKYDWIWCMDDDVFPRKDCLEKALNVTTDGVGIVCPMRIMSGKPFVTEVVYMNLSNVLKPMHGRLVSQSETNGKMPVEIQGMTFEGPLIRKETIEKIGFPNKDLFILYDDTDYSYRAFLAGYKVLFCPEALIDKHNFGQNKTWEETVIGNKWKLWYDKRNAAYFAHHYGENWIFKHFGSKPFYQTLAMLKNLPFNNKYNWNDIKRLWAMDKRGRKEILGKM